MLVKWCQTVVSFVYRLLVWKMLGVKVGAAVQAWFNLNLTLVCGVVWLIVDDTWSGTKFPSMLSH